MHQQQTSSTRSRLQFETLNT